MRQVIYSMSVSLDGFIETSDRSIDWGIVDEEIHTFINNQQSAIDTFVFGRRVYEVMPYWETAGADPSNPPYVIEFARIWQRMNKIVFSKTLDRVLGNAQLNRGNIVDEVVRLKTQPGKDISVGGATVAAVLSQHGLIDIYQLFVNPIILGSGTPVFGASDHTLNLRLIETHTFRSGVVLLRYRSADTKS